MRGPFSIFGSRADTATGLDPVLDRVRATLDARPVVTDLAEAPGDAFVERDLDRCTPDAAFDRLRWGGQVAVVSTRPRVLDALVNQYRNRPEFRIELAGQRTTEPWLTALRHLRRPTHHWFVARKVMLEHPDDLTVRHSHDVRLEPDHTSLARDGYIVVKRVPTLDQTYARLIKMRPTLAHDDARHIAAKLVNKVFPIFLTREAAFLQMLRGRLPAHLRSRVPGFVRMERDQRGFVRRLDMSWMRLGGKPMSLLTFARQAAAILHALHHYAGVLHFDLRLENMVITEDGVGLIDFGSSVTAGEDLAQSKLLNTLHTEMLNASRPAAQLRRLQGTGIVTSGLFHDCYARRSPAIDLFCLAWFMTRPHAHPDFRPLVRIDPNDADNQRLLHLQRIVLDPPDPQHPMIRGVRDLLDLLNGSTRPVEAATRSAAARRRGMTRIDSGQTLTDSFAGGGDDLVAISIADEA